MIEQAPLQPPQSAPEVAPGLQPDVLDLDPHSPLSASEQIVTREIALGRHERHIGLSYEMEEPDGSTTIRVVSGREMIYRHKGITHDKAGPARILGEKENWRRVWPWQHKDYWPFEDRKHRKTYDYQTQLSIDVYQNGRLIRIERTTDDSLTNWLDSGGEKQERPTRFWWVEERPEQIADRAIAVDLSQTKKPVMHAIAEVQQQHELATMKGLRYTLRDHLDDQDYDMLVDREVIIRERTTQGWTNERYLMIKKIGPKGVLSWTKVNINAFNKRFSKMTPAQRLAMNMHFEVPSDDPAITARKALGQLALSRREAMDHGDSQELELDEAYALLSSPDVYGNGAAFESKQDEIIASKHSLDYAVTLAVLAAELQLPKLINLAERMRDHLLIELQKAGLQPSNEDKSISWALWALAKQRFLAEHSDAIEPKDQGMEIGKAIGYGRANRDKQNELISQRIGQALNRDAVIREPQKKKQKVLIRESATRTVETEETLDGDTLVYPDVNMLEEVFKNFRMREMADEILSKVSEDDPELSYVDQVGLGDLLRSLQQYTKKSQK